LPYRLKSEAQAREIKGIGANLAQRVSLKSVSTLGKVPTRFLLQIGEIIAYGRSERAVFEDTAQARAIEAFGKIYGVGEWGRGSCRCAG
jgi:hypothetical protein